MAHWHGDLVSRSRMQIAEDILAYYVLEFRVHGCFQGL